MLAPGLEAGSDGGSQSGRETGYRFLGRIVVVRCCRHEGGSVLVVEPLGSHDLLTVRMGSEQIKVSTRPDMAVQVDEEIGMRFEHDYISWLDTESGSSLGG